MSPRPWQTSSRPCAVAGAVATAVASSAHPCGAGVPTATVVGQDSPRRRVGGSPSRLGGEARALHAVTRLVCPSRSASRGSGALAAVASSAMTMAEAFEAAQKLTVPGFTEASFEIRPSGEGVDSPERVPTVLRDLGELRAQAEAVLRAREGNQLRDVEPGALGLGTPPSGSDSCTAGAVVDAARPFAEERRRLEQREAELAERERQLASREQRLAEREADAHADRRAAEQMLMAREQAVLERERRLANREEDWRSQHLNEMHKVSTRQAELANKWKELSVRQDEWRIQQMAEKEKLEALSLSLDKSAEEFREEEARTEARLKGEEERLKEVKRQIDERELRWSEACKEANVVRTHMLRPRFSPRSGPGKENQELQRQLEEQASRMQQIKRGTSAWSQPGFDVPITGEGRSSTCSEKSGEGRGTEESCSKLEKGFADRKADDTEQMDQDHASAALPN